MIILKFRMNLSSHHWALLNNNVSVIVADDGFKEMSDTDLTELKKLEINRTNKTRKALINAIDKRLRHKLPDQTTKKIKREKLSFYLKGKEPNLVLGYKMDGRHIAKQTEDIRVQWICDQINQKTELGLEFYSSYKGSFGKEIEKVVKRGGNRDHYDILIYHTDGTTKKCEEKGTDIYHGDINTFHIPWENSVQRFNGPGNKFSVGLKYAELWWKIVICDPHMKDEYVPDINAPSKEEYLKFDAFACGDPKTEFCKCLKRSYRIKYPGSCMNGKKLSPHDYRENVNQEYIDSFSEGDKHLLLEEVQNKLDEIMNEKECWLQTSGKIDDNLSFKWYDKIASPKIKDVSLSWKKGADIYFNFIAEDEKYNFKCILRFGKGTGFSNIRFDIR